MDEISMPLHYLKTAYRTLVRNRGYALLTILGLALGFAGFLTISYHVVEDFQWDSLHENRDNIYIVLGRNIYEESDGSWNGVTMGPLGPALKEALPEVRDAVRIRNIPRMLVHRDRGDFYQQKGFYTDTTFFEMFSFPVTQGSTSNPLSRIDAIMIREDLAARLFGTENPINRQLVINDDELVTVTGVFQVPETGSHLDFTFVRPITVLEQTGNSVSEWDWGNLATYLLMEPGFDEEHIVHEINDIFERSGGNSETTEFSIFPLKKMHLFAKEIHFFFNHGKSTIETTVSFSLIGLFLLSIACINYINFSTAMVSRRARDTGVRKISGAKRIDLILSHFFETILLSVLAFSISLVLIELLDPLVATISGRNHQPFSTDATVTWGVFCISLLFGILAAIYPAIKISSIKPVTMLKGQWTSPAKQGRMRRVLVAVQFCITLGLIFCTIVVTNQFGFLNNAGMGINTDDVLLISLRGGEPSSEADVLRQQIMSLPGVEQVGFSANFIGVSMLYLAFDPVGLDGNWAMDFIWLDGNCRDVYDFDVVQGRFLSDEYPGDNQWDTNESGALVINESAARQLGWDNPIGHILDINGSMGTIVGVIRDFHNASLHHTIQPTILCYNSSSWNFLNVRLDGENRQETLDQISLIWSETVQSRPFHYYWMEEEYADFYTSEKNLGTLLAMFSILAITISCIGLSGLAAFATQRRSKEVSIRKVFGASIAQLISLVTREYVYLVLIAASISLPLVYLFMQQWLNDFAYRTEIQMSWIVVTVAITIFIALFTVLFQTIRIVLQNPANVLRHE